MEKTIFSRVAACPTVDGQQKMNSKESLEVSHFFVCLFCPIVFVSILLFYILFNCYLLVAFLLSNERQNGDGSRLEERS